MKVLKLIIPQLVSEKIQAGTEAELGVLDGVRDARCDWHTKECVIEYDEGKIDEEKIRQILLSLRHAAKDVDGIRGTSALREHLYYVKGMHCASCEILIEKRLLKMKWIKSVEASTVKGQVLVEYEGHQPNIEELNKIFKEENYSFFEKPPQEEVSRGSVLWPIIFIIAGFFLLNKMGLTSWVNVSSASSLPTFFFLGLVAGLSSCAALVGGLVLSMSKQWLNLYSERCSAWEKFQPHLIFNVGRLISYGLLGAILGELGGKLQISFGFTSFLVLAISVLMLILGLQMAGMRSLRRFQITMPKFITRYVADESKFQGRYIPFLLGALTFFLPCGFTITTQGLALLSGSAWQGGLIMFFFALGTTPTLLAIGASSVKFASRPHLANRFLKIAGAVVIFFAFFNINAQLNVLGWPSFSGGSSRGFSNVGSGQTEEEELPPIVGGKQKIKMEASSNGYNPNYFKVRAGVPVRWEITDTGTSGCTNAIISRSLFDGEISLTPGETSVKEFTPQKAGRYKFSCWMGMISGIIEVVDGNNKPTSYNAGGEGGVVPSGAKGCGCGGGGGSCGASAANSQ